MDEIRRIQDQLRRAFEGAAWHGPSLKELLSGVTADAAAAKPFPSVHSIQEIILHIAAWKRAGIRMLSGEAVKLEPEEDWPHRDLAWEEASQALDASQSGLLQAISHLSEAQLEDRVPGQPYSVYFLLHGIVQHDLYHAGQIAILRKRQQTP